MRVPQIPGYDASLGASVPMLSLLVREELAYCQFRSLPFLRPSLSSGAQFAVSLFFAVFPNAAAGDLPFCNSPLILTHTVLPVLLNCIANYNLEWLKWLHLYEFIFHAPFSAPLLLLNSKRHRRRDNLPGRASAVTRRDGLGLGLGLEGGTRRQRPPNPLSTEYASEKENSACHLLSHSCLQ